MAKNGKARVLNDEQFQHLLRQIKGNRHPEKNALIVEISFKLGLRVQEMSLLRIKEIADLGIQYPNGYRIKDVLILPKSFTKGARAKKRISSNDPTRRSVKFSLEQFDNVVSQITKLAQAGAKIEPSDFYPPQSKSTGGKTRELPLTDQSLRQSIERYLNYRISKETSLKSNAPLILSQKGGSYSPNTLQEHISLMLKKWAGVERASSHSGRRTLATKLLHEQGEHLKTVQQVLGHKEATTTVIYHELPENELKKVLNKVGKSYKG